jgi:hypothetical protein
MPDPYNIPAFNYLFGGLFVGYEFQRHTFSYVEELTAKPTKLSA